MKTTKFLKIGNFMISNTEDLAKLVMLKGGQNICDFLNNMKCLKIETDLDTETGVIKWATEDGDLIPEKGYHYSVNCFI